MHLAEDNIKLQYALVRRKNSRSYVGDLRAWKHNGFYPKGCIEIMDYTVPSDFKFIEQCGTRKQKVDRNKQTIF